MNKIKLRFQIPTALVNARLCLRSGHTVKHCTQQCSSQLVQHYVKQLLETIGAT